MTPILHATPILHVNRALNATALAVAPASSNATANAGSTQRSAGDRVRSVAVGAARSADHPPPGATFWSGADVSAPSATISSAIGAVIGISVDRR